MRERRPDSAEGPVLIAIDHLFVGCEADDCAQAVYSALGALDATWPAALVSISVADLATLVAAARTAALDAGMSGRERAALQGAARRVGHVLERAPRLHDARRAGLRILPGSTDQRQQGGAAFTRGSDVRYPDGVT